MGHPAKAKTRPQTKTGCFAHRGRTGEFDSHFLTNLRPLTLDEQVDSGGRRVQNRLGVAACHCVHASANATFLAVLHSVHSEKGSKHNLLNFRLEYNHMNKAKLNAMFNYRTLPSG